MSKPLRPVKIRHAHKSYFVEFVHRKPKQHHCAAVFADDMKTPDQVKQWIADSGKYILSE